MNPTLTIDDPDMLLQALIASSGDCIKILDLDGKLVFMTETAQRVMEVSDFSLLKGCPWADWWTGKGNIEAKAAMKIALTGKVARFQGFAYTLAGTPKSWDVTVSPIFDAMGRPEKLLSISRDITDLLRADSALQVSEKRLRMGLAAGRLGYWDLDLATETLVASDTCKLNYGCNITDTFSYPQLCDAVAPEDRERMLAAMAGAIDSGEEYDIEYRVLKLDGTSGWLMVRGQVVHDDTGRPTALTGVSLDISRLKLAETQQQLLTHELEHRMRNTMAMVMAIANQTFRAAKSKDEAQTVLAGRLLALDQAHTALTRSSWTGATLLAVVETALLPHRSGQRRFKIEGPVVQLNSKQALSLTLALHELATNATKYGALSMPGGTVSVSWRVDAEGNRSVLKFVWRETGGPSVETPTRRGFGSRLIESTLAADFGAVTVDYASEGVVCSFETHLT